MGTWTLVDNWAYWDYFTDVTGMVSYNPGYKGAPGILLWIACHGAELRGAKVKYYDYFPPVGTSKSFSNSNRSGDLVVFEEHLYMGVDERIFRLPIAGEPELPHDWQEVYDFDLYASDPLAHKGYITKFATYFGYETLIALVRQPFGTDSPNVWIFSSNNVTNWTQEFNGHDDWPLAGTCYYCAQHGLVFGPDNKFYALVQVEDYPSGGDDTAVLMIRDDDGAWHHANREWVNMTGHGLVADYYDVYALIDETPSTPLAKTFAIYSYVTGLREYESPDAGQCFNSGHYFYGNMFVGGGDHTLDYNARTYKKNGSWDYDGGGSGHLTCGWQVMAEHHRDGLLYAAGGSRLYRRSDENIYWLTFPKPALGKKLDVSREDGSRVHIAGMLSSGSPLGMVVPRSLDNVGVFYDGSSGSPYGVVSEHDDHDDIYLFGTIDGSPIQRISSGSPMGGVGSEFSGQICRNVLVHELAAGSPVALTSDGEAWESDDRGISFHKQGDIGFDPLGADREPEDTIWTGRFGISGSAVMKLSEDTGQSFGKRDTNLPTTNYVSDVVIEP